MWCMLRNTSIYMYYIAVQLTVKLLIAYTERTKVCANNCSNEIIRWFMRYTKCMKGMRIVRCQVSKWRSIYVTLIISKICLQGRICASLSVWALSIAYKFLHLQLFESIMHQSVKLQHRCISWKRIVSVTEIRLKAHDIRRLEDRPKFIKICGEAFGVLGLLRLIPNPALYVYTNMQIHANTFI